MGVAIRRTNKAGTARHGRLVRVSEETHRHLQVLADEMGASMQDVIADAVEAYRRRRILEQTNAGYAALRADSAAWAEELAERHVWDVTLADGLEDA